MRRVLIGLAAAVVLVACAKTTEPGRSLTTAKAASPLPAAALPASVLSGGDHGLLIGRSSVSDPTTQVWLIDADGKATQTDEVPRGQQGFLARVGDQALLVATRCQEDVDRTKCPGYDLVATPLGNDGKTRATRKLTTISADATGGISYVGTSSTAVWISTEHGLLGVGKAGTIIDRADRPSGEPCAIGNALYDMQGGLTTATESTNQIPGQPAVPVTASPKSSNAYAFKVEEWNGSRWEPVTGGDMAGSTIGLVDGYCTHGGYTIMALDPVASWTPTEHWTKAPRPNKATPRGTPHAYFTSTRSAYRLLRNGHLQTLRNSAWTDTSTTFAAAPSNRPPAGLVIDDSGTTVLACAIYSGPDGAHTTTDCRVTTKN